MIRKTFSLIVLSNLIVMLSCSNNQLSDQEISFKEIKNITSQDWAQLKDKRIFFGHQSVGRNILDGVQDLMGQFDEIDLNISETKEISVEKKGIFAHSKVGKNEDPISKINHFKEIIEGGVGEKADIVFLKFCYIDFSPETSAEKVFKSYQQTVDGLKKKYENLNIVHLTVPLTTKQTGIKALVKKVIGRPIAGIKENIVREEYNHLLREYYGKNDSLFDLAKIQSTTLNGEELKYESENKQYFAMNPAYTYDDGHLNQLGRQIVAEKLLCHLSKVSDNRE